MLLKEIVQEKRYAFFEKAENWQDAIEKNVPAKFLELNRKAFELGRNA